MALADITHDAVLKAVAEHDRLGDEAFRATYGFGAARRYVLNLDGRTYDSRAIAGVAHQYVSGTALPASEFTGGEATVVARLTSLGFDVRDLRFMRSAATRRHFGEIAGVAEGTAFTSRREAAEARVHRALQAGIVGTAQDGAESVVVSGGYEDDEDLGTEIIYTGHGGRGPSGAQVADQTFDAPGNAALVTSQWTGQPVRVLRGPHKGSPHAPQGGYRYDGLFRVEDSWTSRGRSGFAVCRYRLVKVNAESLPEESPGGTTEQTPVPNGNRTPGRRASTVQRLIRSTEVADYVKGIHNHTCQACGIRLTVGSHGYSEGAHIKALGRPHLGPDIPSNVLCLCPNCHVLFDAGALIIDPNLSVYVNGIREGTLRTHPSHIINAEYVTYHRNLYS
jgi:putative restriction endonuclease